jgi:hypothetical protein
MTSDHTHSGDVGGDGTMADMTFEENQEWGTVAAIYEGREIAGLEEEGHQWTVSWGSGYAISRSFRSREAAETFVRKNAGDLEEGLNP